MTKEKKQILIALKKANSLTGKLIEMLESGQYCIDIMQQNMAVIGLLKSAHQQLMANHLNTCFKNAMASRQSGVKERMVAEILKVNKLANK